MTTAVIKPEQFNLDEKQAIELTKNLQVIISERTALQQQYEHAMTLDMTDEGNSLNFKKLRLAFVKNRTAIDKWHKGEKEIFLRAGQFIDAIRRKETAINEHCEEKLEAAERYFENLEKQRLANLKAERLEVLTPLCENPYMYDKLEYFTDDAFKSLVDGLTLVKQQREQQALEEAKRKEEQERKDRLRYERKVEMAKYHLFYDITGVDLGEMPEKEYAKILKDCVAKLDAHIKEEERMKAENERLRKEQEQAEAKANAEREAAAKELAEQQAKAKAEQDALEAQKQKELAEQRRIADELLRKQQEKAKAEQDRLNKEREAAEAKLAELKKIEEHKAREAARVEAERKIAEQKRMAAPDKEKLEQLCKDLDDFKLPEMSTDEGRKLISNTRILLTKIKTYLIEKQQTL